MPVPIIAACGNSDSRQNLSNDPLITEASSLFERSAFSLG